MCESRWDGRAEFSGRSILLEGTAPGDAPRPGQDAAKRFRARSGGRAGSPLYSTTMLASSFCCCLVLGGQVVSQRRLGERKSRLAASEAASVHAKQEIYFNALPAFHLSDAAHLVLGIEVAGSRRTGSPAGCGRARDTCNGR